MAVSPTITNSSPVLITSSGNFTVSYQQILGMLNGNYVFEPTKVTIISNTFQNIQQPLQFQYKDANGVNKLFIATAIADISQHVTQIELPLKQYGITFDGQTFMNVNVQPYAYINYLFDMEQYTSTDLISF